MQENKTVVNDESKSVTKTPKIMRTIAAIVAFAVLAAVIIGAIIQRTHG